MKTLLLALLGLTALVPANLTAAPLAIEWASQRRLAPAAAGNDQSFNPSTSSDGRFVAFPSRASNLVAGDSNNAEDVFVYDSASNTVERVSVNDAGEQGTYNGAGGGNAESKNPSISADGRYVAFQSRADNLVPGDDNGQNDSSQGQDIFVYDRTTKTITRVSLRDDGGQSNQASETPSISGDGHYVAFASSANNLVSGFVNGEVSVYVSDRTTGRAIAGVPLPFAPAPANRICLNPAISSDGAFVAFEFYAEDASGNNLWVYRDIYRYNVGSRAVERITGTADGLAADRTDSRSPAISADGRYIALHSNVQITNDSNFYVDVFVHDCTTGFNQLVSVDETGGTQGTGDSMNPSLSGDGRFVAFESWAANLVNSDTNGTMDIFRKDLLTGEVSLLSMTPAGIQGDGASAFASVSSDGGRVAFQSDASNLATGDDNNDSSDIFVAEAEVVNVTPPTLTIDRATPGSATVSWTPATPGFVLQQNASLAPANWTNSPSGAANPIVVPTALPTTFYRLMTNR